MLARRILACLDVDVLWERGGWVPRVVKGVRFRNLRDVGDPVELGERYNAEGADELVFLDVTASAEGRGTMVGVARRVAERLFIPFTVGGGIRAIEDMENLLEAGADKVSLGTAAVEGPALVEEAARRFGSQFVVVSIDARRSTEETPSGHEVTTHGGRRATGKDALAFAREMQDRGAGEVLLNAMDADGRREGFAIELTRTVATSLSIPVIASGGAGGPEDFRRVFEEGRADAALAASIFHEGAVSIAEVKRHLAAHGVPVRPTAEEEP